MAGFKGEEFEVVRYFAHNGSGDGESAQDPAALATNAAVVAIPVGCVVYSAAVIVTAAVTGSTAVDVGDGADADGFVATASITLGTPGAYGGTGAFVINDVQKYYSSADNVALAVTGASTAGSFVVVVRGYAV